MNKSYEDRINDIRHDLYEGGGEGQAHALLTTMMSGLGELPSIDPVKVLNDIGHILKQYQRIILSGGIIPVNQFRSGQPHNAYACLDNELKFCVRHYGEDDWKDILYVFPYMNCTTAYDVTFRYDTINMIDV